MSAANVRAHRTLTTHVELDALPDDNATLVRGRDGQVWERSGTGWECLEESAAGRYPTSSIVLPAHLLFVPGEEVTPPSVDPSADIVEQATRVLAAVDGVTSAFVVPDGSLRLLKYRTGAQALLAAGLLIPGTKRDQQATPESAAVAEPDTSPTECIFCGQDHPTATACPPLEFPGTEWDQ